MVVIGMPRLEGDHDYSEESYCVINTTILNPALIKSEKSG